jgi:3',5'-nucleoside bisphosphate phosphatase
LIDLHLHTTASDGRLAPAELVARAGAAGITAMSVTDHDTVAGLAEARQAASEHGIEFVDGIEITAVYLGRDVHLLGYFFRPSDESLTTFLASMRMRRVERVREIGARLATLGVPIDVDALLEVATRSPGVSVGRPAIARALIDAGHVASMQEAFDRYLATGQAAFVPRVGCKPEEVVDVIHRAGGVASMAHPGVTKQPTVLASLVTRGLDALEAYHSDHLSPTRDDLLTFARTHHLLVTGGSDFHGDDSRHRPLGGVALPASEFGRLKAAVS